MGGIKDEIAARHQEITSLLAAGKNKEVLEFYTDDCVIMPPGRPVIHGKEAYLKLLEASAELQSKIEKNENVEEEVFGEGDVVTSRSKGTAFAKDGSVVLQTKSMSVWKKVGGKWLIHNLIWNTDKPFSF